MHHGDDALATQLTRWCRPSSSTLFLSKKLGELAGAHRMSRILGNLTDFANGRRRNPRSRSKKLNAIPYLQTTTVTPVPRNWPCILKFTGAPAPYEDVPVCVCVLQCPLLGPGLSRGRGP